MASTDYTKAAGENSAEPTGTDEEDWIGAKLREPDG